MAAVGAPIRFPSREVSLLPFIDSPQRGMADVDRQFEKWTSAIRQLNQIAELAEIGKSNPISALSKLVVTLREYLLAQEQAATFAESKAP